MGRAAPDRRVGCEPGVTDFGEVAERLKAHAWKVCIRKRIEGSNPSLSAIFTAMKMLAIVEKFEYQFRFNGGLSWSPRDGMP